MKKGRGILLAAAGKEINIPAPGSLLGVYSGSFLDPLSLS